MPLNMLKHAFHMPLNMLKHDFHSSQLPSSGIGENTGNQSILLTFPYDNAMILKLPKFCFPFGLRNSQHMLLIIIIIKKKTPNCPMAGVRSDKLKLNVN